MEGLSHWFFITRNGVLMDPNIDRGAWGDDFYGDWQRKDDHSPTQPSTPDPSQELKEKGDLSETEDPLTSPDPFKGEIA